MSIMLLLCKCLYIVFVSGFVGLFVDLVVVVVKRVFVMVVCFSAVNLFKWIICFCLFLIVFVFGWILGLFLMSVCIKLMLCGVMSLGNVSFFVNIGGTLILFVFRYGLGEIIDCVVKFMCLFIMFMWNKFFFFLSCWWILIVCLVFWVLVFVASMSRFTLDCKVN